MGFNGLIIADDLHMGAIIEHYTLDETIINSLSAGVDQLMFSNNPLAAQPQGIRHDTAANIGTVTTGAWQVPDINLPEKVSQIISAAVQDGRLPMTVIERAYQRITALKARLPAKT
jgi:beta-N-acetylhexosaminidase